MIIAGPLFGKYIAKKIHVSVPRYINVEEIEDDQELPSFGLIANIILVPLLLILFEYSFKGCLARRKYYPHIP
ncbi:hypothetical protein GCM10020331_015340 [Ectobacillus funiculus]